MTPTTLSLEPDTYDVELNGKTYTTRPFTLALRTKLKASIDVRGRLSDQADRLQLRQVQITEASTETDLEQLQKDIDKHAEEWRDANLKLIVELLVDEEGKAPTQKLVSDHAGSRAIARVVGTVIGVLTPDPTTASTDES